MTLQLKRRLVSMSVGVLAITGAAGVPAFAQPAPPAPAATAPAAADESKIEEQYMAVAAARTRAELAIRRLRKFLSDSKAAIGDAGGATEDAKNKMASMVQKAMQNEQHRPEADRSQDVMADLMERGNRINQDWQKYY